MSGSWGNTANGKISGSSGGTGGWGNTAAGPAANSTPAQHHHGGGLFHRFASDLYNTAVHSPSGLYHVGKDLAVTEKNLVTGHGDRKQPIGNDLKAVAQGYKEDVQHPLRHPGNTFLDAVGALSLGAGTAARVGEVGRVATAGGDAGEIASAAIKGPKPATRVIKYNGQDVQAGQYSRAALRRGSQRLLDKFQQRFPDVHLPAGNLHQRVGREIQQNVRITEAIQKAPAARLAKVKLKAPEQKAIQVVAEGVPIDKRIEFHQKQLESFKPNQTKLIAATKKEIALLRSAKQHVHDVEGMPRIDPANHKLVHVYEETRALANKREQILAGTERLVNAKAANGHKHPVRVQALSDEARENRVEEPAAIIRGENMRAELGLAPGRHPAEISAEMRKLEGLLKAKHVDEARHRVAPYEESGVRQKLSRLQRELAQAQAVTEHVKARYGFNPDVVPELFRFPYKTEQAKAAIFKPQGFRGGIPKTPGSLNHEFTGALLKSGTFRNDTTKLVAESYLEAHRYAAVIRHRDQFLKLAHDIRESENDVPIRTDALHNKAWPKAIQDLTEKPELSKDEMAALNNHYEDLRSHLFPTMAEVQRELKKGEHPQVKWIDKRVLGGLNEANPTVSASTRRILKPFDAINNASRAAILYLKPAYAVPNILGNAALNLVQQGFAAPVQIAHTARTFYKLDKETAEKVKLAMGEGISGSLENPNKADGLINWMANQWQKPVDTPFRLNAFFYEARRAGYKTPAQIKALMNDEKALVPIAREANAAIIDYGNLSPAEQSVIRRVIFFYPWVKGSTRYAGRYLTTHSAQASLLGQEGKIGARQDAKDLGPLPSYAEGLFKVGERGGNPLVANPSSAGILQTPAQLGKAVAELTSAHPGEAFQLSQNLTPALAALLATLGGSSRQRNQSELSAAKDQLVGGLPLLTAIQQMQSPPSESRKPRVYPRNREDVLLHFLLGGLAPSPLNKVKAEQAKYLEDHPR